MNIKNILFCLVFAGQASFAQIDPGNNLKQLSKQHQFTKMDSLNNKIKSKDYYFYKGLYANVCNNPKLSNMYLDSLKNNQTINSYDFVKLRNDNYIKLFNYDLAYNTSKTLTSKFQKQFTKDELLDEINTQRIWQTLKGKPAQSIEKFSTLNITTIKDKAGLITTAVSANGTETNFVFDTGAGISCITESMAKKMGVIILPDNNISIESFTGQKNKVLTGIAPEISLGELKVHNAMFLVYPDTAFTFANGAYVINGIIGFPIVKELGTITIEKDKLTFSKDLKTDKNEKNLFVDELRAIVMLTYKGKTLPFNFDSGAKMSLFNKAFYETFKSDLDLIGNLETSKSSGAGGEVVSTEVLVLKDQKIYLGKNLIQLQKMEIDRNDYGVYGKVSFGNIGQDIIGQYKKVIISFEDSYLKLEN
jgi:predicted aspartyl protease